MKILFLTTVLPSGRATGGEVASQAVVDALRPAARVLVVGYRREGSNAPLHEDDRVAGERPIETSAAGPRAAAWMALALVRRLPYSTAKYASRAYQRLARDAASSERPDLLVLDHAQSGWLDPGSWWTGPMAFVAHNAESQLYADGAASASGPTRFLLRREARRMRALEAGLVADASEVWTLTESDAASMRALARTRVRVVTLPGREAAVDPPSPVTDVALLGQWTWAPNQKGLRWFLECVVPELSEGTSVAVAGAGAEHLRQLQPGVRFAGRVPDPLGFLSSARVVAVPSVAGGGIQVKTLDAIASGRAVVATGLATRGIDPLPSTLTVADDPADFAAAVEAARSRAELDRTRNAAAATEWAAGRRRRFTAEIREALDSLVTT